MSIFYVDGSELTAATAQPLVRCDHRVTVVYCHLGADDLGTAFILASVL